jgi:hypothetical protein
MGGSGEDGRSQVTRICRGCRIGLGVGFGGEEASACCKVNGRVRLRRDAEADYHWAAIYESPAH